VVMTVAPAALACWMAARPTPPEPPCTRTVSPDRRWPNSKRQSSAVPNSTGTAAALLERHGVRYRPRLPGGDAGQLGVGPVHHHGDDALADRESLDAVADVAHDAARLVADDVRDRHQLTLPPVDQVTSLYADGPHLDEQATPADLGVRDVGGAQHVRAAVAVVDSSFHLIGLHGWTATMARAPIPGARGSRRGAHRFAKSLLPRTSA
jgi:hypothetical protein